MNEQKCFGNCFINCSHGYKRPVNSCNCILFKCTCCEKRQMPEMLWLAHEKRCMGCAIGCGKRCRLISNDLCKHCGGKLMPIGNRRANGKLYNDWDNRRLHKKCWMEIKKENDYIDSDDEYESESDIDESHDHFMEEISKQKYVGFSD